MNKSDYYTILSLLWLIISFENINNWFVFPAALFTILNGLIMCVHAYNEKNL